MIGVLGLSYAIAALLIIAIWLWNNNDHDNWNKMA